MFSDTLYLFSSMNRSDLGALHESNSDRGIHFLTSFVICIESQLLTDKRDGFLCCSFTVF